MVNLYMNPKKNNVVTFIRRRRKDTLRKPSIFGEEIKYFKESINKRKISGLRAR